MAERPLIVGEHKPYGSDPQYAIYPLPENSAGGRLCSVILGMQRTEYLRAFNRVNLCSDKWSMPAARQRALQLMQDRGGTHILLGRKVASAYGLATLEALTCRETTAPRSMKFLLIPHPSGLNRFWNAPDSVTRVRMFLTAHGVASVLRNT